MLRHGSSAGDAEPDTLNAGQKARGTSPSSARFASLILTYTPGERRPKSVPRLFAQGVRMPQEASKKNKGDCPLLSFSVDPRMGVSDTPIQEKAMNKGSKRVTIRIGDQLLELVREELDRRSTSAAVEPWTVSDYIIQAVAEKLSKARRSRGDEAQVRQEKVNEYLPREVSEE